MWINPITQTLYRTKEAVRRAFPNISFTDRLADEEFDSVKFLYGDEPQQVGQLARVTMQPAPQFNPLTHELVESAPTLTNGSWIITRIVIPRADSSTAVDDARAKKRAEVAALLDRAVLKRELQAARSKYPALVQKAQDAIALINASDDPESIDLSQLD